MRKSKQEFADSHQIDADSSAWNAFLGQLAGKIDDIETYWQALIRGPQDHPTLLRLHHLAQALLSACDAANCPDLVLPCQQLEAFLAKQLATSLSIIGLKEKVKFSQLVETLKAVLKFTINQTNNSAENTMQQAKSTAMTKPSPLVYIVDDDPVLCKSVEYQLRYFGYQISIFHDLASFDQALGDRQPAAILMDVELPDGKGPQFILKLKQAARTLAPVIFISSHADIINRLSVAKAGGYMYLVKPVNLGLLVDKLDELCHLKTLDPYRVLIIDQSKESAQYHAEILNGLGMAVELVNKPLVVLSVLEEFNPDLILMDVVMSDCSGSELAKVIRQQERYVGVPIIFLSETLSLDAQLTAKRAGGDDFIAKPIDPVHLAVAVTSSVRKSRTIRSLMFKDSLTGLLNHTATIERLTTEISRAQRLGSHLVFAMLDIDRFKSVNDNYGHPVGDRVIKSISRTLQQRLRRTDVVGRYGGEEFGVILLDTDTEYAKNILDEIRKIFSEIEHDAGLEKFRVTFSCGIADYPRFADMNSLLEAADIALYHAKTGGRNRVYVHGE